MEASAPRGCTCVQKHNRKQKLLPPACTTCTEPFGERLRSHMFKKNHIANIKPYTRTVHRRRISSARSKVQTSSSSFWFLKKMDIVAVMKTITNANNLQGFSNMRCLWKALTTHPPVKKLVVYQSSVGIIWQHQRDGLKWYKIPLSKMFTLYTRIKLLFTQLYTAIAGPSPVPNRSYGSWASHPRWKERRRHWSPCYTIGCGHPWHQKNQLNGIHPPIQKMEKTYHDLSFGT